MHVNWMGKEPKTGHGVSLVEGMHRCGGTGEGSQAPAVECHGQGAELQAMTGAGVLVGLWSGRAGLRERAWWPPERQEQGNQSQIVGCREPWMFTQSPDHLGSVGDETVIIRLHLGGGKDDAERIPRDPGTGSLGPASWTWQ